MKELKGYQRVLIAPNETKTVTFDLTAEALAFYNIEMKYVVEKGGDNNDGQFVEE